MTGYESCSRTERGLQEFACSKTAVDDRLGQLSAVEEGEPVPVAVGHAQAGSLTKAAFSRAELRSERGDVALRVFHYRITVEEGGSCQKVRREGD